MTKLIVIGTLHAGLTPEEELFDILNNLKLEILLIEMVQKDVEMEILNNYPPEMISAYHWAKKQNISVYGFDSAIHTLRDGMTEQDNQDAIDKQKEIMKKFTWKDINKEKNLALLNGNLWEKLVDPNKHRRREEEMIKNIKHILDSTKTTIILTGCAHLKTFEQTFPQAIFPFR